MNQGVVVTSESAPAKGASVEALVQDCLPSLQKWAHGKFPRVARPEFDTQDLVQEAALRMLSRGNRFEPRHANAVQAYMRQTVLNLARDRARRLAHREQPLEHGDEYPCQDAGPLDCAIDQEHRARYEEALRRLTPKDRQILIARVKDELNARDIAHAFGLPSPDAARMAIARAMKRLMHKLNRKR